MNRLFVRAGVAALTTASLYTGVAMSANAANFNAGKPVKVAQVFFAPNSSALSTSAKATLSSLAPKLSKYSDVTLTGYIQKTSTTHVLKMLGLQRAQSVKAFLVSKGVKIPLAAVGGLYDSVNPTAATARNVTITGVSAPVAPKYTLTVNVYSSFGSQDQVDSGIGCFEYKYVPTSLVVTGPGGYNKTLTIATNTGPGSQKTAGAITTASDYWTCTYSVSVPGVTPGDTYALTLKGQDSTSGNFGDDVYVIAPSLSAGSNQRFSTSSIHGMAGSVEADVCTGASLIATEPVTVTIGSGSTSTYMNVLDNCI